MGDNCEKRNGLSIRKIAKFAKTDFARFRGLARWAALVCSFGVLIRVRLIVILAFLTLFFLAACGLALLYGLFLALFRKGRRKRGAWIVLAAPMVAVLGAVGLAFLDARQQGWAGPGEKATAAALGFNDAAGYAAHQKQQAERIAATERRIADRWAAEQAEAEARLRLYGGHCLHPWDGSHLGFVVAVKAVLRDPDSFEHIATRTMPVDAAGKNVIFMDYRARNGFGGMIGATAVGSFDNATCDAVVEAVE